MTDLTTATRCGVGVREHLSSNSMARFMEKYAGKRREKQERRPPRHGYGNTRFDIAIIPEYVKYTLLRCSSGRPWSGFPFGRPNRAEGDNGRKNRSHEDPEML
jgi:hypothetical protein